VDEGQALLRGILAEPDEDAPRLVYADWLEENGQPERGRHVRLQCEMEHLPEKDAHRKWLSQEAAGLEKKHLSDWLGPLDPGTCYNPSKPSEHFRRGLLYWWDVTPGPFLQKAHQRDVCEWFPKLGVERLFLSEPSKRAKVLAQSPALGWLVEFTWARSRAGDDDVAALATSPHLGLLSKLDLTHLRCSDAGIKAIARSKGLANLREFSVRECNWGGDFTSKAVLEVLNSDRLPKLRALKLADGLPSGFKLASVLADAGVARLKKLTLFSTARPAAITALATNPAAAGLEEVLMGSGEIDDASATALLESPHLGALKKLQLTNVNNGSERRLSADVEARLKQRFGPVLEFKYGSLVRG
jgi:uncharacterized protein (TIGR02996 family)